MFDGNVCFCFMFLMFWPVTFSVGLCVNSFENVTSEWTNVCEKNSDRVLVSNFQALCIKITKSLQEPLNSIISRGYTAG